MITLSHPLGGAIFSVTYQDVAPWPAEIAPGGAVGMDFSGEVRSTSTRLFRRDEL